MKKVLKPTVRKTHTVSTIRIPWRALIGLLAAVMSMVVPSRAQLHHVPPAAPTYIVLHSFAGQELGDGRLPRAGLLRDAAGNLYGTTAGGGAANYGQVFELDPGGNSHSLYDLQGGAFGGYPYAGLVRDAAGNLYGTTFEGGATSTCNPPDGCGVVFKLSSCPLCGSELTETVLHTFTGADGAFPQAGLIRDAAGNLYGTTRDGGTFDAGVVFELIRCDSAPSGYDFKILHSFTGERTEGIP
jgi:uncharacterized repeat protein (TIGR03803 family)